MNDPKIVISYHRKDKRFKEELEKQLALLRHELKTWSDADIPAGADTVNAFQAALDKAVVAIFLISVDSLSAEFLNRREVVEMLKHRAERNLPLFPLLVSDCLFRNVDWLSRLEIRPKNGQSLDGMERPRLRKVLTEFAAEVAEIFNPSPKPELETRERSSDRAPSRMPGEDQNRIERCASREKQPAERKAEAIRSDIERPARTLPQTAETEPADIASELKREIESLEGLAPRSTEVKRRAERLRAEVDALTQKSQPQPGTRGGKASL